MMNEKNSRRSFFGRVAAAVGVIAAAAYTKTLISGAKTSDAGLSEKYSNDASQQEEALMANRLVVMTDAEKKQRLDELLSCHSKELS
ncbi:hypothetical protein OYT1_ch0258 [Ferriphaselus amnicola]|uniref:Uncharacterized protein n=1 Tax=Ferriphaselus amnicola TaxID=1188319 RepID=A0A2Z6G8N8_9PROT|nr:hypothetical protein [Ferriphaselus amnicola]BBE49832.1 hypothetical protein OYT1_ch0258 [Ferriphaselus amnicola]